MADTIRLNKVLRELNISIDRVADFLESKGHSIEKRPTTKISKDLYNLLCDEFQIDADKKIASKEVVEAKNKEKEEIREKQERQQEVSINPQSEINYPKNQYRKFIKEVVSGTLERSELIEETITNHLSKDINLKKTDKLLKIILFAAIYELLFKHKNPKKVIINEYVLASEYFLEKVQIGYLNAILDKISKVLRKDE